MAESQDVFPGKPDAPRPIVLSAEELQVLRECRKNAYMYRGFPLSILSFVAARQLVQRGYFKRYSTLFYTSVLAVSFVGGTVSYIAECAPKKLMALANSEFGDRLRARKSGGLPINGTPNSAEFADDTFPNPIADQSTLDPDESPMNKKLENPNRWDELRKESRLAQYPTSETGGTSYDELRRRNRSHQGSYKSLTPEEEADMESMKKHSSSSEMATFKAGQFDDYKSSASEFSEPDKEKPNSWDTIRDNARSDVGRTGFNKEGAPRKNKYGDDM